MVDDRDRRLQAGIDAMLAAVTPPGPGSASAVAAELNAQELGTSLTQRERLGEGEIAALEAGSAGGPKSPCSTSPREEACGLSSGGTFPKRDGSRSRVHAMVGFQLLFIALVALAYTIWDATAALLCAGALLILNVVLTASLLARAIEVRR